MTVEGLAEGLKHLGYRLDPSEVRMLTDRMRRGEEEHVRKSAFLASQLDWAALLQDHRCHPCKHAVGMNGHGLGSNAFMTHHRMETTVGGAAQCLRGPRLQVMIELVCTCCRHTHVLMADTLHDNHELATGAWLRLRALPLLSCPQRPLSQRFS